MVSKKQKRHSGWCRGQSTLKEKKKWIINNCLEPHLYYDDWEDYRDGQRAYMCDCTKICKKDLRRQLHENISWAYYSDLYKRKLKGHYKQKKLLLRRKAMKNHKF